MRLRAVLTTCLFAVPVFAAGPKPSPEAIEFFEKKVRPVFAEHCYECHGEKKQSAGLRLDNKTGMEKGTEDGPVVVAGEPDKSPLIKAVRHGGEVKMPPKKPLPPEAVEALAAWVKLGAPYPEETAGPKPGASHWAFQQVKRHVPPATKAPVSHPVDRFIQAKQEAKELGLSPAADKRTLIRRLSYDLTGLLPTPEQIDEFVSDPAPDAYERLVDRLLDSPHYGEHQARHWMDLARYSDTKGYVFTEDRNYPFAYTYRGWLIRSFNADLPYDQFILHQLAADRLVTDDKSNLAAMGFLTVGRRFLNNQPDIIDDRLDATFRTFQGLTVTCARCHDHKYDPIPTRDYYSLYGVFASSEEPRDLPLIEAPQDTPEVRAFEAELKKRQDAVKAQTEKLRSAYAAQLRTPAAVAEYLRAARDAKGTERGQLTALADERKLIAAVIGAWKTYLDGRKADPVFTAYRELAAIPEGEFAAKSPAVFERLATEKKAHAGVVAALAKKKPVTFKEACEVYGELLMAPGDDKALAAVLGPGGPLDFNEQTFRRVVNRKERDDLAALVRKADEWRAKSPVAPARAMVLTEGTPTQPVVFVRGNPNNRGPQVPRQFPEVLAGPGRKPFADGSGRLEMARAIADPKNPLTARVMANRAWAHLFGQGIVRTPSDFGTRCDPPTHPELLDWLAARFVESGWSVKQLYRLIVTSQAYRQSSAVSPELARLDPENRLLGRMARKRLTFEGLRDGLLAAAGRLDPAVGGKSLDLFKAPFTTRRAVYAFIDRQNLPGTLRSFDFALPDTHAPQRFVTTVPQQALFLLNSPFVIEQAKALAARAADPDANKNVRELYRLAYGRPPTPEERALALEFVNTPADAETKSAGLTAWEQLAQVLLLSNEFAFVD
jgi:Protein of unknown function (DUF1553)/Protein of unknown function (DUF1549)/Planctomycete cytochrome C